jgi:NhaP-type Na+/H+ or K+/H+ antiporter
MSTWKKFPRGTVTIMTWGGLCGGISVALALSLPPGPQREQVLAMTYVLVVFSILVQGLSIKSVVLRLMREHDRNGVHPGPTAPCLKRALFIGGASH